MLIKVHRGTSNDSQGNLCDSCRHSRIIRGHRLEEEIVSCDATPMHTVRITFKVTSCTDYIDEREPSYHELLEQAWILRPASRRRAAGFVRATDLAESEMRRYVMDPTEKD